jgi:hypothetical protein
MKSFKQFKEDIAIGGPTNVTAGVSVGPNDIGVHLDKFNKRTPKKPLLTTKPLSRKM